MANKKHSRILRGAAIAACYLLVWEAASLAVGKALLLPGPGAVLFRFAQLLGEGEAWKSAGHSLLRILLGYAAGVAVGTLLAALCAASSLCDSLLRPLRSVIKATPVTSFILLALLWLTSGVVPGFISFLMVLPIVWASVYEGIVHTDPRLVEMTRVFGFSRWKRLEKLYVPAVLPQFLASSTTALGFAWKSGVAAEILALPKHSIGTYLYQSKLTLETTDLFAWTLLVVLLSMALEAGLVRILGRLRHD